MNFVEVIHQVLGLADSDVIGLPGPPDLAPHVRQRTAEVLDESRALIGTEATQSDYFKCSEDRFATLVGMALTHLQPGSRLLDIGNAPGYLAIMLANAGFDIDGINLSEAWNSSYPDSKYVEQFRVKTSDIEKSPLPFPDAIFDAIVFTEVLEHIAIKHPRDLLPEFRRVLRPNGVVVFFNSQCMQCQQRCFTSEGQQHLLGFRHFLRRYGSPQSGIHPARGPFVVRIQWLRNARLFRHE